MAAGMPFRDVVMQGQRIGQQVGFRRFAIAGPITPVCDQIHRVRGQGARERFPVSLDRFGIAAEVEQGVPAAGIDDPAAQDHVLPRQGEVRLRGVHAGELGVVDQPSLLQVQQRAQGDIDNEDGAGTPCQHPARPSHAAPARP